MAADKEMYLNAIRDYVSQLIEGSTPAAPLWNIEKIKDGKPPKWNYIDGCMMTALLNLYERTGDSAYMDFAERFVSYYIAPDGAVLGYLKDDYNLDNLCGGRNLFALYSYTGDNRYIAAAQVLFAQLETQPRTPEGNFWHKKIYPHQVWLDGLYMAQVFSARYISRTSSDFSDIVKQFQNVRKLMFDADKRLYRHAYDSSKSAFWCDENGLSPSFWLRSVGWLLMALTDVIEILPDSELTAKKQLFALFKEAVDGVLLYLDINSGMLFQVVDCPRRDGNYPESSGSMMVAYALMKGARLGAIERYYAITGERIFFSTCERYLKTTDGKMSFGGICLSAGLGPESNPARSGTFEYYISEQVVENDAKGIAPLLLAYTEVLNLQ